MESSLKQQQTLGYCKYLMYELSERGCFLYTVINNTEKKAD